MIFHLTLILACQLAGESVVVATGLPLPGPVIGMVLLFAGLCLRGLPDGLARVGDALLGNLSLLFVPAGVGVMIHGSLLASDAIPLVAALVVSTLLTIVLVGRLMAWLNRADAESGR